MDGERAKAIARAYFHRLLNERDVSICDELLAAGYVDHDAPPDTPPGPAATKQFTAGFLARYPDLRIEIEDMVAEGERVALRAVWSGTDSESGDPYRRFGLVLLRLDASGQIVERWSAYAPSDR